MDALLLEKPAGARGLSDVNSGDSPSLGRLGLNGQAHAQDRQRGLAAPENSTPTDFNNEGKVWGPAKPRKSEAAVALAAPAIRLGQSPPPVPLCLLC